MATNGKITMAVLSTKLDNVIKMLEEHREDFKDHVMKDEGVAIKVDRLDQAEQKRTKHFWAIYPAIAVGYILWFMGWVK